MFKRILKDNSGMTLIEIMVVLAIIGGILAIVGVNVMGARDKASIKNTNTQIANIMSALDQYKLDNHRYPSTDQGLDALVEKPSSGKIPEDYPEDGYMKKLPKDAWNTPFNYASPGTHGEKVEVWSSGPDEEEGTDDDVVSWETEEDEGD